MFSPVLWKDDLKKAKLRYFNPLFPAVISINSAYKYQNGGEKRKYRFTGFEDVSIHKKTYKDCLQLTIIQDWTTNQYIDTVWFLKDFGVVKWLRGTGRLEELKQ